MASEKNGKEPVLGSSRAGWTRSDSLAWVGVTLLGGLLRIIRVNTPRRVVFDEFFYARDACWYVKASKSACGLTNLVVTDREVDRWLRVYSELTPEHPPLGKWLIGTGIRIFGFGPGAWRLASVVAGTLTIALLYLLARRVLASTVGATVAAGLLAIDFLHFVQSRLAMLEIFVTLFGVAAFLFCAFDRDEVKARRDTGRAGTRWARLWHRRWRAAAGVAAGAAAASKLSGWLIVVAMVLLVLAWELGARKTLGVAAAVRQTIVREGPSIVGLLLLIPLFVYAGTYAGRLHGSLLAWPWSQGSWIQEFWARQKYMLDFSRPRFAGPTSPVWSVPMLQRPALYFRDGGSGRVRVIALFGDTIIWWASFAALLYAGWRWLRRKGFAEGLILLGFLSTYGSWVLLTQARGQLFLHYFTPAVPFACLALGYAASRAVTLRAGRVAVAALAAVSLLAFALFYPVLTATPISPKGVKVRLDIARQSSFH
jgi:dolichyl-phosphate-mannose-protein mannosyltransferase